MSNTFTSSNIQMYEYPHYYNYLFNNVPLSTNRINNIFDTFVYSGCDNKYSLITAGMTVKFRPTIINNTASFRILPGKLTINKYLIIQPNTITLELDNINTYDYHGSLILVGYIDINNNNTPTFQLLHLSLDDLTQSPNSINNIINNDINNLVVLDVFTIDSNYSTVSLYNSNDKIVIDGKTYKIRPTIDNYIYLGQNSTAPTGLSITSGNSYFNTTDNYLYVYDGSNWIQQPNRYLGQFQNVPSDLILNPGDMYINTTTNKLEIYERWVPLKSVGNNNISDKFTLTILKMGRGDGLVLSAPTGINCGQIYSHLFYRNSFIKLQAISDSESVFTGWSQVCSEDGTLILDSDKTVACTFNLS
jgi:hypothetical protein